MSDTVEIGITVGDAVHVDVEECIKAAVVAVSEQGILGTRVIIWRDAFLSQGNVTFKHGTCRSKPLAITQARHVLKIVGQHLTIGLYDQVGFLNTYAGILINPMLHRHAVSRGNKDSRAERLGLSA